MVTNNIPAGFKTEIHKANIWGDKDDNRECTYYTARIEDGISAFPELENYVRMIWDDTDPGYEEVISTIQFGIIPINDPYAKELFEEQLETDIAETPLRATNGCDFYVYHVGGDEYQNTGWYSVDLESAELCFGERKNEWLNT